MSIRTVSGLYVTYDDHGTGRPLVLLHAFPLSAEMWRPQVEALSKDFRVIAPNLRGFGGTSTFGDTPSVDGMAAAVAELLDALSVTERVALGGLSMGGYVALAFTRKYPDRLRALILADTRAEPDDDAAKANRDKQLHFLSGFTFSGPANLFDQLLPKMVSEGTRTRRPEVADQLRSLAAVQHPGGVSDALIALRDRPDAGPGLAKIDVPTLVIVGAEDALTPPAMAQSLAGRITGAQLVTIPGAGHLSNVEKPDEFTDAVRRFLLGIT
ncbi:MAG TPA: alpha/beta fold hydrolase [Gemmataceae bacterium]|jgi:pimeloyl-ACP methyl ester carboxylesterase